MVTMFLPLASYTKKKGKIFSSQQAFSHPMILYLLLPLSSGATPGSGAYRACTKGPKEKSKAI